MKPDDIRERDRLVRLLRRQVPGELLVKPTTPELMRDITAGLRDEYGGASEQRASTTRELFNREDKP